MRLVQVLKPSGASNNPVQFRSYIRYFLSDHRPLWAEFTT
jgi:hypothetical protein